MVINLALCKIKNKEFNMGVNLRGRNLLAIKDFTEDEVLYLIKLSEQFKNLKLTGTPHNYLQGKNIVLLFEKTSTRTRWKAWLTRATLLMFVIAITTNYSL